MMRSMTRIQLLRGGGALGATLLALLIFASASASAASYTVFSCRGPDGTPLSTVAWEKITVTPGNATDDTCASSDGYLQARLLRSDNQPGDMRGYHFALPPETRISGYRIHLWADTEADPMNGAYQAGIDDDPDGNVDAGCFAENPCDVRRLRPAARQQESHQRQESRPLRPRRRDRLQQAARLLRAGRVGRARPRSHVPLRGRHPRRRHAGPARARGPAFARPGPLHQLARHLRRQRRRRRRDVGRAARRRQRGRPPGRRRRVPRALRPRRSLPGTADRRAAAHRSRRSARATHTVRVRAVDAAGNVATSAPVTFTAAPPPPTVVERVVEVPAGAARIVTIRPTGNRIALPAKGRRTIAGVVQDETGRLLARRQRQRAQPPVRRAAREAAVRAHGDHRRLRSLRRPRPATSRLVVLDVNDSAHRALEPVESAC